MHNGSPALPLAVTGDRAADLMRQFQHVMQCFLHTQEVVMHDLTLAYLGSRAGVALDDGPTPRPMPAGEARNRTPLPGNGSHFAESVFPPLAPAGLTVGAPTRLAPSVPPAPATTTARVNGTAIAAPPPADLEVVPPRQDLTTGSSKPNGVATPIAGREARPVEAPEPRQETRTPAPPPPPPAPAPAPSAAATAGVDRRTITEQLLAVVSERTGYPPEMLSLEADLEADLGIDSIKRVEISGTIVRSLALPAGETVDIERLTGSRTLREVIETLESLVSPKGAEGAAAPGMGGGRHPFDEARAGSGIGRFALRTVAAPPVDHDRLGRLSPAGVVLILDDETGVGVRLAERLGTLGYRSVRVAPGAGLGRPDEVSRLVDQIHDGHGPVAALVHLAALRPGGDPIGLDADRWRARLDADLKSLFLLAQALRPDLEQAATSGGAAVLAATALGGAFAVTDPRPGHFPGHGGLAGLLKTLAQEWPAVRVKAVDTSPAAPEQVADWLLAELLTVDGLTEVGYRAGRRTLLELVPAPLEAGGSAPPLDGDSVVVVTGGARGITAEAALRIADAYRPTLLLVGRTPPPAESELPDTAGLTEAQALRKALIERHRSAGAAVTPAMVEEEYRRLLNEREVRQTLAQLRRSGARVEYLTCDVRDAGAFGRLIDEVYRTHGRIDGVIHGAGVIEDKLVRDKRLDSFERVVETKVAGALVLAAKLRPETLRFLVFFSSVSGRFGNRGQGDYAAASEVLNKLAQDLDRRWPSRVVSINWGPWLKTGMVTPEIQRQFAERGVALIPPDVGCRMLDEELRSGRKGEVEILIGGSEGLGVGPKDPVGSAGLRAGGGPEAGPALPLLGAAGPLPRGADGGVEHVRTLSLEHDLYLDDHRIDGRPVLPFAMATELMAEVAAAGWPGWDVVAVREVRLLKGITVEGARLPLRVVARPREGADPVAAGPTLDLTISSGDGPRLVHYRAVVELGRDPGSARDRRAAEVAGGAVALDGAGPMPMSVAEAYRSWLFHGPIFQGIVAIESIGPRGARAVLRPSSPRDCLRGGPGGDWLFDPVLVDSALQMQVLWARLHWDVTLLPFGAGEFRRFGPIGVESTGSRSRGIRYELRIRPASQAPMSQADHLFYDSDGRLLGILVGVEGTGSKALNRLAGAHPR